MIKKKWQSKNEGFTLVEVILSIAILALISVPLMKYFAESMSYSVKTAEKQGATLMAQETIEYVKAQKRIVVWQGAKDNNGLTKNHFDLTEELKNKFQVNTEMKFEDVEAANTGFKFGSGSGTLQYVYTAKDASSGRNYDVQVTLETQVDAAAVDKPLLYGINDVSNVIAAEYEQEQDALSYFVSLNKTAYKIGHPSEEDGDIYDITDPGDGGGGGGDIIGGGGESGGSDPGVDPTEAFKDVELLTEEDILKNMERVIHIEMQETNQEVLGGNFITVTVYYVYTCKGISNKTEDIYQTDDLISTNVQYLEGVYLMFSKMNSSNDKIVIEWLHDATEHPAAPSQATLPVFWLVCQNLDKINPEGVELAPDADKLYVEMKGVTIWPDDARNIYTNVEKEKVTFTQDGSGSCVINGLTNSSSPVRIFDVTVKVFREGECGVAGKEELVEMTTTKVE